MARLLRSILVAYFAFSATSLSIPRLPDFLTVGPSRAHAQQTPLLDTLDVWIEQEQQIALERLLANIKPGGPNTEETAASGREVVDGTVLASPSKWHPDYYYQWVRDAAITMSTLVDLYKDDSSSELSPRITTILDAYAKLQDKIQHTHNPSGCFDDLQGLGEPKFQVDGTPFEDSWGRPQRDGPALRALALMRYMRAYNASHPTLWSSPQSDDFFKPLYKAEMPPNSVIKADLEYVSHYWNQSGFDLWEEVEGLHFFTLMVSSRALREGAQIARAFSDHGAAEWYEEQAGYIDDFVQSQFWDSEKGHLVETLDSDRSGLDCGLLLGSLHSLPSEDSDLEPVYPPWSDEILVSLHALVQDQRTRFPINSKRSDSDSDDEEESSTPAFEGVGIGRYPEDIYDGYTSSPHRGGNPWFLCTSTAAHILYLTASRLTTSSNLTITPVSLPFYSSLLSTSSLDPPEPYTSYGPSDALFNSVVDRLSAVADEFLDTVKSHVDSGGAMSEQFDRTTGYMRGARDLTWSYGAFLAAVRGRGELFERIRDGGAEE